jgi:hypothetical protein
MNKHEVFDAWAPRGSPWSAWAKPVLFAHLQFDEPPLQLIDLPLPDVPWAPGSGQEATLVIDLPGPNGVWMGLALAGAGYRPVPLYNACPDPSAARWPSPLHLPEVSAPTSAPLPSAGIEHRSVPVIDYRGVVGPESSAAHDSPPAGFNASLVDVGPILSALFHAAPRLEGLPLPAKAAPAFLLDANRQVGRFSPLPGRFDNRSVSFPTDFPSANLLLSRGIHRAVLVQESGTRPQADLAHTLRRWQEAGIAIELKLLAVDGPPVPLVVSRPSQFRSLWHRLLVASGLRRNPLGGFGGMLPMPSAG